jgi:hypothetical protein
MLCLCCLVRAVESTFTRFNGARVQLGVIVCDQRSGTLPFLPRLVAADKESTANQLINFSFVGACNSSTAWVCQWKWRAKRLFFCWLHNPQKEGKGFHHFRNSSNTTNLVLLYSKLFSHHKSNFQFSECCTVSISVLPDNRMNNTKLCKMREYWKVMQEFTN